MQYESERIEYKSQMIDDIYKEVIAFANTDGGVIYLGIDDKGNLIGIDDVDETYTRLTNGIRDAIAPDVTMFVRYVLQDNKVIRIEVGEGSYKPYYLKSKGMKPTGVYVRQGASSVQASPDQIRRMIKDSDGDGFEDARCLEQELTFEAARTAFQRYGVEFSVEKYRALGITQNDMFTNLALLLSDQCHHTTKIAVFSDELCTEFRDSKEFGGSVFRQFEDSVNYLALCNKTVSTIKGVVRTDKQDYPEEAIREALLNALIHRDYSFSGSIIINVNDSKMEFISLGGLLSGLSAEDIRIGVSQPRNKKLAEIFHRLRLIESYGTGIRRIFKLYEHCPVQPGIEATSHAFKIVLPNMNAHETIAESIPEEMEKEPAAITPQMKIVMDYLAEYGEMTDEELQELLNVKKTRAYLLVRQMNENGLIETIGRGAAKKYKLK
ncbi:MAG: putative DNA binding domain-containing protein [Eubacteriales bacterium]|nr:putative DNA binding domain-containing protein [Eubacteriales bacterium]